jgi:hypothetical protein
MYVASNFKINTAEEVAVFLDKFDQYNLKWSDLLTIDYFYNYHLDDYDGGLSFIDRIYKKLGKFHPDWNIEDLKRCIVVSKDPTTVYADIIRFMLEDPRDVLYYGI